MEVVEQRAELGDLQHKADAAKQVLLHQQSLQRDNIHMAARQQRCQLGLHRGQLECLGRMSGSLHARSSCPHLWIRLGIDRVHLDADRQQPIARLP